MAEEKSGLDDSDVIFIQPPETNEEVDVVDLLAEDDFDAVFNDSNTWNPETDHSSGAQSNGKANSLGVKSEVFATDVNIAVTNRDSATTTTSGKRKADDRGSPSTSANKAQNLRKKSRVSDPSSSSLVAVTDISVEDANSDNEIDCAAKPGKTNTILKRIGISDIDSYERKQRRSNRIEKLRLIRDSQREKDQLLEELARLRAEVSRSDRVQMNLFRKVESMEKKASSSMETAMTLKQEKRSLEKNMTKKDEELRNKGADLTRLKKSLKDAQNKIKKMASTAELNKKTNAAASVDKTLLQQARSETKKAKSLCVSLEKKVADLKQKANTLTKSLANSASTRKKVVEEYKTKLIQKEKEVRALQIENKNQMENATDAASEMMAKLKEQVEEGVIKMKVFQKRKAKEIAALEKELNNAKKQLSLSSGSSRSIDKDRDTMQQTINDLLKQCKSTEKEVSKLKSEAHEASSTITNLREEIKSANTNLKSQEEVMAEMVNEQREKFDAEKHGLMDQLKKWKAKFENLNTSISKQAEQSSNDTKALKRSLKAAKQEVEALKSSAATLQSAIESKDSKMQEKDKKIASLMQDIQKEQRSTELEERLKKQIEEAKKQATAQQNANKESKQKLEANLKEIKSLRTQASQLKSSAVTHLKATNALKKEVLEEKMKVTKLTSKTKELSDALEADRISAKQSLQEKDNEIQKLQLKFAQQIKGLKESASSSDKHTESSDMEVKNLNDQIEKFKTKNALISKELEVTKLRSKKFWKETKRLQALVDEMNKAKQSGNMPSSSSKTSTVGKSRASEAAALKEKMRKLKAKVSNLQKK